MRRLAPGDARATHAQRTAYLRRYTQLGDPEADAVVAMFARLPPGQGRRLFEAALEYGIDTLIAPPDELREFFAAIDEVPYWVDTDQLERGCRVIGRAGPVGATALAMLALCGGYLAARVAKPLVATGELAAMAPRRLGATMRWWTAVTTPGGMDRYAPGFTATVRVRLTHALVRAGLSRRPDWDHTAWDTPLNASQLAGTITLFALAHLAGSQAFGIHFTAAERESVYAVWRYIGHVMGVRPQILPSTERDAWRMWWLQSDYEFRQPDQDSKLLAQALISAIGPLCIGHGENLPSRLGRTMVTESMSAYARLILGRDNADFLGLADRKAFQACIIAAAAAAAVLEYPRRAIPGATRCAETIGRRAIVTLTRRMAVLQDCAVPSESATATPLRPASSTRARNRRPCT